MWRINVNTHGVDSCQQQLCDAAQDLCDRHLVTEQQVGQVRSLHVLIQVNRVLDFFHLLIHQLLSCETQENYLREDSLSH